MQVDFGKLGMMFDAETGRRRAVQALVFTACYSRHCFVWLTFSQALDAVIAGFEAAWEFFDGVFKVVIPDNMATIVAKADSCAPGFNETFVEDAQSRGLGLRQAEDALGGAEAIQGVAVNRSSRRPPDRRRVPTSDRGR